MRTALRATAAAVALLATAAAPAAAQTPAPCKIDLKDAAFDNTSTFNASPAAPVVATPSPSLDLRGLRVQHDAAGTATTVTLPITNLSRKIPLGSTSTVWTVQWTDAAGVVYFVRAVNDLTDNLVFEWGEQVPPIGGLVLPRFEYRGATTGRFVPGVDGLIEITVPAALSAPGTVLADMFASTSEGRQVLPNAATTPSRGLSNPSDRAPDGTDTVNYTVRGCPPAA